MKEGDTFLNPATVINDSSVTIGADTVVYPFVTLEGTTRIGEGCVIEPGVHLVNVTVGDDVHVKTGSVAEDAIIGDEATVGPYAHLRPGTQLGKRVKVGNFVETKKAVFGEGAKASHLSYIGDADVGANVNIGAGTITCNYDGKNKHQTVIEDGAFIGSDSQLVAPIRIGRGAYVGAGSTITKDVPPDALALTRAPQKIVEGWARRRRWTRLAALDVDAHAAEVDHDVDVPQKVLADDPHGVLALLGPVHRQRLEAPAPPVEADLDVLELRAVLHRAAETLQ